MAPSKRELLTEVRWRRCEKDCFYFLENYWSIRHPERGRILLELRDAQRETLNVWLVERMSIALKARQIGFSTLAAGLVFWHIFFHSDRFIITLSKTEREAQKLKKKIDYGYRRLPEWMRERGPREVSNTLSKLEFDNDSSVEALPATDPARGESAYLIIVDEWAFFEDPEAAWAAIEPAIDIGGRVICLSTANGSGNLFHTMVVGAMAGTNDFKFVFHSWRAVPERNNTWYESKRRSMLEWQLHQEYPSTPDEAFIKSGNPVFDVDQLAVMDTETPMRGYVTTDPDGGGSRFFANVDGPLRVWEHPQPGRAYVIGADVAEGLEHGDYSCAHVIDTLTKDVVAKWHGHVDPDLFGTEVLWHLGHYFNAALIGVESNNHGLTTLVALNGLHYPNLYRQHTYNERTKKRHARLGWRTQVNTKPLMIDELAKALRMIEDEDGELGESELTLLCEETIGELRTYRRDERGKMSGSPFDDRVMSLGIANQMLKHHFTQPATTKRDSAFTFDWWASQAEKATEGDSEWIIGAGSSRRGL